MSNRLGINSSNKILNCYDLEYVDIATRNIDNMMQQFDLDRKRVVNLVDTNVDGLIDMLWSNSSPVCFDEKCLFNMGRTFKEHSLEERINGTASTNANVANYYVCPQCTNMKRILDISNTRMGKPFYIECGQSAGNQLVLTESDISKLYIIKESPPPAVKRAMTNPYIKDFVRCSTGCNHSSDLCQVKDYDTMNYIGSDPYTNNLLINWYLEDKLAELGLPSIIKMHIGFVCGTKGYSLYEYPDIGRLRHMQEYPDYLVHEGKPSPTAKMDDKVPISKEVVKGIIMQLFATLHALRPYDFSHGGPSSRSILIKNASCSYLYDGVHVESPVTLKLCDLHHAGITVGNNRLYNKSVIADEELLQKPFKPIIEAMTITPFVFDRSPQPNQEISVYRLKDPTKYLQEALLFMYIKHLGLPIYQASFDAYGFMISLMSDRSFYTTVLEDESMYTLWKNMWLVDEFDIIQQKMRILHASPDPITRVDKVLRTLAGFGLRCDMIEYGWNLIKTW